MLISITRLRLRSRLYLPVFYWNTLQATRQVKASAGFESGKLLSDHNLAFWTMTLWTDLESMRKYLTGAPHGTMMPKLMHWCDEGTTVHWDSETKALPSWEEAHRELTAKGRIARVLHPSKDHASRSFPPPRPDASSREVLLAPAASQS